MVPPLASNREHHPLHDTLSSGRPLPLQLRGDQGSAPPDSVTPWPVAALPRSGFVRMLMWTNCICPSANIAVPHLDDLATDDSWQTGLGDAFSGANCAQIASYLTCCTSTWPEVGMELGPGRFCEKRCSLPAEYDFNLLYDSSCCPMYVGVRCD